MAKNKKSKILAMALCASVMAGIYASPVMAKEFRLDGNSSVTTENTTSTGGYTQNEVRVNISDGISSDTIGTFYSNEEEAGFKTDYTMTDSTFTLEAGGRIWASLTVDGLTYTNQNTSNTVSLTADGLTFSNLKNLGDAAVLNAAAINFWNEKTQNIDVTRTSAGTTTFKGNVNVDGAVNAGNGSTVGGVYFHSGNVAGINILNGASVKGDNAGGLTISGVNFNENVLTAGAMNLNGATGGFYVKDIDGHTMIYAGATHDGPSTLRIDPENGNLATKGTISVGSDLEKPVTMINGDNSQGNIGDIAVGINYNTDGTVAGANIVLDADTGNVVAKGGITAADFNDVTLAKNGEQVLVGGIDISALKEGVDTANDAVGGIRRSEGAGEPGTGTTTIENNLKVSGDKINMFGDTGLTFEHGTMNNVDIINVSGNIGFRGDNVYFSYGNDSKITTLGGLALTVDQIANDVSAIKEKTDHITVDDKGNVTISADDGSSLTVGKDGTSTGQGGQVTTDGNHTVNGDLDVDSSGQIDKDLTVGGDLEVGGKIDASEVNVGNTHITKDNGIETDKITVSGQGGSAIINGGYVGGSNDVFIDANGNNIFDEGETSLSGVNGKVDKVASDLGDVSILDPEIAGDSSNDGQNDVVGAVNNEAEIRRNEIERVDGRINNLENRVGELEDRIDKVGAMAAAIANLRTMGYDPAAPTEVAVGIGQYRDETGAALGLFHYPNRDFMLSLSVSTSGDEVMGGIGATWKFGRKSPEKVAEIKKAQAEADARRAEEAKLAKAEEMKQAAKEAKIKAQQERHAKLAAERAAQAEAAK